MPRFRNDGDNDVHVFGLHGLGSHGAGVCEVPEDYDPAKLDYLRRTFTEVKDEPKTKPKPRPTETKPFEVAEEKEEPKPKRRGRPKKKKPSWE